MRYPNAIEIYVNIDLLNEQTINYLKENFDFEYNAQKDKHTLWIHDDGNFPFERELFQYMYALTGVYNNRTKQDHLDLFIETTKDNIDEYGKEITLEDGMTRYFKNLIPEDLFSVDLNNVILKKELNEISN